MTFDQWKDELEKLSNEGPFAIADIDIDKFSLLNKEYGRDCGDRVFEILDKTLKENPREALVCQVWRRVFCLQQRVHP